LKPHDACTSPGLVISAAADCVSWATSAEFEQLPLSSSPVLDSDGSASTYS
jgi:hypothetical protein